MGENSDPSASGEPIGGMGGLTEQVIARLRQARHVIALTGAGISAESGIPTFRTPGSGLWDRYPVRDFATPEGWARNPQLVWGWYTHRRRLARRSQPNAGHLALATLEAYYPNFTLVTQNVDGLHSAAGSQNVLELHGSLRRFLCSAEGTPVEWADPQDDDPEALAALERGETPPVPTCPQCGALLRPAVVWFGENLPEDALALAEEAARHADVCFVVGTSALVYPAADLPRIAQRHGALIVEVNPEPTELSRRVDVSLRAAAGVALPRLVEIITATTYR